MSVPEDFEIKAIFLMTLKMLITLYCISARHKTNINYETFISLEV